MGGRACVALIAKVDCIQIPVPDLEEGLASYRDRLGHALLWRSSTGAGLRLPCSDAELVLQTERAEMEVNFLVEEADRATDAFAAAGARVLVAPFDVPIGRCAVVADPWGNRLVVLDCRNGTFTTDAAGGVIGVDRPPVSRRAAVALGVRPDKVTRSGR